MKICMQQPQYLPYIGFFNKLMQSDLCIILDDVEYSKNDFFNRNKIKTPHGWCWLTIPVKAGGHQLIKDVKTDTTKNWEDKHLKSIVANYGKAPFFLDHKEFLEEYYSKKWTDLTDVDMCSLEYIAEKLDAEVKFIKSSTLDITSKGTQRLVDICKELDADTYISGTGARDYMEGKLFEENDIKLLYQNFKHPVYQQRFGEFIEGLSTIDLLFNNGKKSIEIVKNAGGSGK